MARPQTRTDESSSFFVQDDESALSLLLNVAGSIVHDSPQKQYDQQIEDTASQLQDLGRRFQDDYEYCSWHDICWSPWIQSANSLELVKSAHLDALLRCPSSRNEGDGAPLPMAFESELGKAHLQALSSILGIPQRVAVQYTLSALRSLSTKNKDDSSSSQIRHSIQTLMGTRLLLLRVLEYYARQRLARIATITECLRILLFRELQDNKSLIEDGTVNAQRRFETVLLLTLKDLDGTCDHDGRKRGLFRLLLCAACQPHVELTYQQLEPTRHLRRPTSMGQTVGEQQESINLDWNRFARSIMHVQRMFLQQERLEALEALVVLLYERHPCLDGGVHGADLAILLVAFQSANNFFSRPDINPSVVQSVALVSPVWDPRPAQLAGLICTEVMSLGLVSQGVMNMENWAKNHPLLVSLWDGDSCQQQAKTEVQRLTSLVTDVAAQINGRLSLAGDIPRPEAVLMLAWALLMEAASTSEKGDAWLQLRKKGRQLLELANSEYGAFSWLCTIATDLMEVVTSEDLSRRMVGDDSSCEGRELTDRSLIYSYICRDLLTVMVHVISGELQSKGSSGWADNIAMLCDLTALVFRGSPTFGEEFWVNWDLYTNQGLPAPLCILLDSAYALAQTVVDNDKSYSHKEILRAIVPLLTIVSAFAYSSDVAEATIEYILPLGVIRKILLIIASTYENLHPYHSMVWKALASVARVGQSEFCRRLLLDESSAVSPIKPAVLLRILEVSDDDDSATAILILLSNVISHSTEIWSKQVALGLLYMNDEREKLRNLLMRGGTCAVSLVELIRSLIDVIFQRSHMQDMSDHITVAKLGVVHSIHLLTNYSLWNVHEPLSYSLAQAIMDCMTHFLRCVCAVTAVSPRNQDCALAACIEVLHALSEKQDVGDAIVRIAVAPVCSAIAFSSLEASQEYEDLAPYQVDDRGASLLQTGHDMAYDGLLQRIFNDVVRSNEPMSLDLGSMKALCSVKEQTFSVAGASRTALALLNSWSKAAGYLMSLNSKEVSITRLPTPHHLLARQAEPPYPISRNQRLAEAWSRANISNFTLLLRYMTDYENDELGSCVPVSTHEWFSAALADWEQSNIPLSGADVKMFRGNLRRCLLRIPSQIEASELDHGCSWIPSYLSLLKEAVTLDVSLATDAEALSLILESFSKISRDVSNCLQTTSIQFNDLLACKLKVVKGLLDLVLTMFLTGDALYYASQKLNDGLSSFLRELVSFLVLSCEIDSAIHVAERSEQNGKLALLLMSASSAFEILTLLLALERVDQGSPHQLVVRVFEDKFGPGLEAFLSMSRSLSDLVALERFALLQSQLSKYKLEVENEESGVITIARQLCVLGRERIVCHAWSLYESISIQSKQDHLISFFWDLSNSLELLSCEVSRLQHWHLLADSIARSIEERRDDNTFKLGGAKRSVFLQQMAIVSLDALHLNLARLAKIDNRFMKSLGVLKTLTLLAASVFSCLRACDDTSPRGPDEWLRIFEKASETCKLYLSTSLRAELGCLSLLLASVSSLYESRPAKLSQDTTERRTGASAACSISCEVISLIGLSLKNRGSFSRVSKESTITCLSICVQLLSELVLSLEDIGNLRTSLSTLLHAFKAFNVVQSLIWILVSFSTQHDLSRGGLSMNDFGPEACSAWRGVLQLFTLMAASGNGDLLAILVAGGAGQVIKRHALLTSFASAITTGNDVPLRGYLHISNESHSSSTHFSALSVFSTKDDPAHKIWCQGLVFLAIGLRASRLYSQTQSLEYFSSLAADLVTSQISNIHACFRQCNSIAFDSKFPVLTTNLIREATLILSIIVEVDNKVIHEDTYAALLGLIAEMTAGFGSFLGASGVARDLFRSIDEFESWDAITADQGIYFATLGAAQHLLAGGQSKARHEAIRHAHFVARCSAVMTEVDFDNHQRYAGYWETTLEQPIPTEPDSLSSLERNCRSAVTSAFSFQLEEEVAKCSFFALYALWRAHPLASSFVPISDQESIMLGSMQLVKPGVLIAFHEVAESNQHWSKVSPGNTVLFGEVLRTDSVHRQWLVRLVAGNHINAASNMTVSPKQLAGIEDAFQWRSITSYRAAPDSSVDLQACLRPLSVGHLILVLRWCSQIVTEQQSKCFSVASYSYVKRLAELATAFIGMEVAVHSKTRRFIGDEEASHRVISAQLLDLYCEKADFGDRPVEIIGNITFPRDGRMKGIIDDNMWRLVREQLRDHLRAAVKEFASKLDSRSAMVSRQRGLRM